MKNRLIFLSIFSILSFIELQVPFTKLASSNVSFTLFDFFAPMVGAFLGPVLGIVSVLGVEVFNMLVKQTQPSTGAIIRLFPMLFGVLYFALLSKRDFNNEYSQTKVWSLLAGRNKLLLLVPIFAMMIFIAHPIGREVWYYSLFWLIPVLAYFKKDNLLIRSLGTTFFAHSVGGAAWIWAFNLPASVWNSLIPIVIQERLLFALGIAGSYLLTKYIMNILIARKILPKLPLIAS